MGKVMNGFTKKSIRTLTLGEKLAKLRNDRRISLSEVARVTKIKAAYLEALEEGNYHKLPADVYVKGFLRSYADFLCFDEKIFLKLYEKEKGIKKNLEKKDKLKKEEKKPINISSFVFTPQKILFLTIVVVVFSGLFFLYQEIDSFASAPSLIILTPENDSEISENSVSVEGVTDKDAVLFINNQPILVNDEGKFMENLTLQSGLNVIGVKAVNKFGKEMEKSITVKSNFAQNEESSEESAEGDQDVSSEELSIDLRVDPGPVWLNVEADGELVFSGTMLSGAVQTFHARENIVVSSGKGNATFVTLNGEEIGSLSENPEAVRGRTFTLEDQVINR
jgi:cytoskeleton protein RodZ